MAVNREKKVPALVDKPMDFCPGCGHGIISRLIMEAIEELEQTNNIIFPIGVGCSSNLGAGLECDRLHCCHGRAGAVATGMKRVNPDVLVVSYQGDGDAYVIGLSETLNAAHFGAPITTFVINNNNYGMTGGQMSWTTLPGQKTTTSPAGRNAETMGLPIDPLKMAANLDAVAYVARGALNSPKNINTAKRYIKRAVELQIKHGKYAIVELLSPFPTDWNMTPVQAIEWIEQEVTKYYPLGEFKTTED